MTHGGTALTTPATENLLPCSLWPASSRLLVLGTLANLFTDSEDYLEQLLSHSSPSPTLSHSPPLPLPSPISHFLSCIKVASIIWCTIQNKKHSHVYMEIHVHVHSTLA